MEVTVKDGQDNTTGIHAYGTHGLYGTGGCPQARRLFSVDVIMYLDLFDAARSDEPSST